MVLTTRLQRIRVLYVEDDPTLRSLLVAQLQTTPEVSEVHAFGSPADALEAFAGISVDVALLDL